MTLQAQPIARLYRMEDEQMQTRATTMHGNLSADIADFQAKFMWIDVAFLLSFLTDITTAKNYQLDEAVQNTIKVLTEDVEASVAEGMKALDTLDIYARLAFSDSAAKQRVFGQNNWDKARRDQQKMVNALELAHSFANNDPYKTALLAKGMVQADIDSLETIAQNIDLKDTLQEHAKSGRPISTENRIKVNNIVWSRMQIITTCSELVYRDDAAKREQYQLYPSSSGGGGGITFPVFFEDNLDIGDAKSYDLLLLNADAHPTITLILENLSSSTHRYYVTAEPGAMPPASPVINVLPDNAVPITLAELISELGVNSTNHYLTVFNVGPSPSHFKVIIEE